MSSFVNSSYSLTQGNNGVIDTSNIVKYIDVSSNFRDRKNYPNPCDFLIPINYPNRNNGNFSPVDPISNSVPYTYSSKTVLTNVTGVGSTTTNIVLDPSEINIENVYVNSYLQIPSISLTFFSQITYYNATTKTATVATPFSIAPGSGVNYTIRFALPLSQSSVSATTVPTTTTFSITNGVATNNAYVTNYIYFSSGSNAGLTFLITGYTGSNKQVTVSPAMPNAPAIGDTFDMCSYTRDNAGTLSINSLASNNQLNNPYYEIELLSLMIPKTVLNVSNGGILENYPFVYVVFYNEGKNVSNQVLISNNPSTNRVIFKVPVDNYSNVTSFYTLFDCRMKHILLFEPTKDLRFQLVLPDGNICSFRTSDNFSPNPCNPFLQVSATFAIRRIK